MNVVAPPKGWVEAPLGKVAKIERKTVQPEAIQTGTIYLGLEHITSEGHFTEVASVEAGELASNKFAFSNKHLLYGKLRPYLKKLARPNFSGICSTDILPFLPGTKVDRDFLYYYLRQPSFIELATARSTGANLPRLSPTELSEFPIVLPPLEEQRRIAAILDRADAVRRKRQEAIALTEELLRSAFLEMFGDPVKNPKGWKVTTLETTFSRNPQIGTTKPAHADGEQIVVRVGEIGGQNVELNKCGCITLEGKELERFLCEPGDLLLARAIGSESHLGKASILQPTEQIVVFDSHVMRLRFNTDLLLPIFFLQWLKTDGGRTRFMREAGRTAVQFNVNATQISRVEIPLPPIKLQKKFVSFYTEILEFVENYGSGYETSNDLFNSLLQRAFQGEL